LPVAAPCCVFGKRLEATDNLSPEGLRLCLGYPYNQVLTLQKRSYNYIPDFANFLLYISAIFFAFARWSKAHDNTNSGDITIKSTANTFRLKHVHGESLGPLMFGCADVQTHAKMVKRQLCTIELTVRSCWPPSSGVTGHSDAMVTNTLAVATELDAWSGGTEAPWSVCRKAKSMRKTSIASNYGDAQLPTVSSGK
jgi:hypothetical protein